MKLKRNLAIVLSISTVLLYSVFALCLNESLHENPTDGVKVTNEIGWAEPELIIGQPRLQKVNGFYYLYAEMKHLKQSEVSKSVVLIEQVNDECMKLFGCIPFGAYVEMYINSPQEEESKLIYDCQKGYALNVEDITPKDARVKIRYVEPALCASILVWGSDLPKGYGPLMNFIQEKGLRTSKPGCRREWGLYEDRNSKNHIALIQRVIEE